MYRLDATCSIGFTDLQNINCLFKIYNEKNVPETKSFIDCES